MADVHRKRTGKPQADISIVQIHLTTKEAQVLQLLAENPGRIFSRDSLLKTIWGYADGVMSRTADVHIQRLRKKLKGNLALRIRTIVGEGYVLEYPGQSVDSCWKQTMKNKRTITQNVNM